MEKIDEAMISAVSRRMFAPARLRKILHAMLDRSDQSRASVEAEVIRHRASATDAKGRLKRLYDSIEAGVADLDDPEFKARINLAKLQVREAENQIASLGRRLTVSSAPITERAIRQFADAVRQRLRSGDPSFRRYWLHTFVDQVLVGPDRIVIRGSKEALFSVVESGGNFVGTEVPSFAQKWRARNDSNVRPSDS